MKKLWKKICRRIFFSWSEKNLKKIFSQKNQTRKNRKNFKIWISKKNTKKYVFFMIFLFFIKIILVRSSQPNMHPVLVPKAVCYVSGPEPNGIKHSKWLKTIEYTCPPTGPQSGDLEISWDFLKSEGRFWGALKKDWPIGYKSFFGKVILWYIKVI